MNLPRIVLAFPLLGLLGGCNMVVMNPSGDVAMQQRDLIIASTLLMLLIILPVMAATVIFAWRYRASNTEADYDPDWHHSTRLEVLIWTAPLMIIIALGALTWISTHLLDPFRPLERIDGKRQVNELMKPVTVEVVALDWKWMFVYPELGIATVNELAAPVDVPINFKITSAAIMNSFFVPALAGQIYAMAGMETKLHAVINKEGEYNGFSANYSGSGFSGMNFKFRGMSAGDFDAWVAKVKAEGKPLDRATYLELEKPSERHPVTYFASVENGLYQAILNMCATPGKMCMNEMMHIDASGGGGEGSEANRERLIYDAHRSHEGHGTGDEAPGATFPSSGRTPKSDEQPDGMKPESSPTGHGAGDDQHHNMPGTDHGSPAPTQLNK